MMTPTIEEERLLELRGRGVATPPLAWRSNGPVLAMVFFALTCAATAAMWGLIFMIIESAKVTSWLVAVAAISLAEWLIRRARFYGTGVEAALCISGLFCIIFGLPGEGSREVMLLFAAASAIAGFRMRNPFFGVLAFAFVVAYLESRGLSGAAAAAGVAAALMSLFALVREWRRPSTDMLWIALLVIAPIAGAVAGIDTLDASWAAVFGVFGALCVAAGLLYRDHAPLIAAVVNFTISGTILAAHDLLPLTEEWRLMTAGAALLACSAVVSRILRDRSSGVVVTADALTRFDEELQMIGTVALQPRVDVAPPREGGDFGGAGATGKF